MGSYRFKEDEVLKISTSVFVANFPDSFGAKDLRNTCKQYGQVVDAYISYRRSKACKRFGFVRFIKVLDVDRLVNNLCTVWVGRHKLQANSLSNGVKGAANSYAHVVKGSQNSKMDSDSSPVIVLDDSCLNEKDYSLCLLGKVKDFATLANLKVVVANEGFDNIKIKYMGGAKEVPGWIPDFVEDNDKEEDSKVGSYEEVPNGEDVKNVEDLEGHFKKSEVLKSGGSILQLIDDLVKVEETMGYGMKGCMKNMEEIIELQGGNDDYFVMVRGDWMPNGKKLLIITVYAPQELSKKKMLWDYLSLVMSKWEREVVIMGDFNEVCNKSKRFRTLFNRHGADVFNHFISNAGLEEVPLKGCSFTWCHRSATKMSKLDHFLISDSLLCSCLNISSITLDRTEVVNLLQEVEKNNSLEVAQKAKIKCAIEGDENSKYYHGVINKKRNQLSIRGILVEGTWIDYPSLIESQVSKEEIKKVVWDCGIDKSPGLDGFTFGFYRQYWKLTENDVVDAVTCFFHQGSFPKGGNSSFIILIPKTPNANMVKDYKPISLIGSMYKIISKILANRLVVVLGEKETIVGFKVDFEKPYDSVRWDHLDDIMRKFGFGEKSCMYIQSCLRSSRGSVIINGSPTEEFQFYKGLKQVDVGLFKGIELAPSLNLSHMFYADDTTFMVSKNVLHLMKSMRSHFFNGAELSSKKLVWVKWKHALASKDKGGLGVSSLFALNIALMFKWVWRFITQGSLLWARVIKALHGYDGKIGQKVKSCYPSLWLDIIHEVEMFKSRGIDLALEGSGEFTITSVRKMIDNFMLPEVSSKTRWIKAVPIEVNMHAWKVKLDGLPTRLNISRRGIDIESIYA
uniref:RNA-directed DNA polymerase, eukaryota, reverse transcriptase zinc-binding domain protein n=1 Tax=Tanacetum cinerariifolium TaxID=118510 RepID=A0A699GWX2_TANCI|nr:RNA-directed DNA polymerase, eukaryota, reverse transcriptase zinc-binding domain protein [Tanacetum cinerariifolium]